MQRDHCVVVSMGFKAPTGQDFGSAFLLHPLTQFDYNESTLLMKSSVNHGGCWSPGLVCWCWENEGANALYL